MKCIFQSTQPKRAATEVRQVFDRMLASISIHAAQEGCDHRQYRVFCRFPISIHAAQEGCDLCRLPIRGEFSISIHAAQEGCDKRGDGASATGSDFNPRSPRGLRPCRAAQFVAGFIFQSTQPKRAATNHVGKLHSFTAISIHAAQEGCDNGRITGRRKRNYFNPRSPRGLRRCR